MASYRASIALVLLLALGVPAASGCTAAKVIRSAWPKAFSERSIAKPVGPPRWPLTGLDAPDARAVARRVISVKIENSAAARPQSGLDQADVIYETVTEAGITRFNALFQSKVPKAVGPVRSARASDLFVVPQYRAIFAHCGGGRTLHRQMTSRRFGDMDQFYNPSPYYRNRSLPAPHNLFVDLGLLRAAAAKRGFEPTSAVRPFAFERSIVETAPVVTSIKVPFAPDNKVTWTYSGTRRTYLRSINGTPHKDRLSGRRYSARNVVVMWAKVKPLAHRDVNGVQSVEIVLAGDGRASVFRDGGREDGNWKAGENAPPTFTRADGTPIKLSPGNTWFEVIANNQDISFK